jgi:hypothetical protein
VRCTGNNTTAPTTGIVEPSPEWPDLTEGALLPFLIVVPLTLFKRQRVTV